MRPLGSDEIAPREACEALLAEPRVAAKRLAAEVTREHGACRALTRVGDESEGQRWHVLGPR